MNKAAYRSLYAYAWDIADVGVGAFIDEALKMGISDVSVASAYHAGKFIRPHAKHPPHVIFPEDGVTYFQPDLSRYGELQPQAHSDATLLNVIPALLADGRLRVHGWTVLLHNTRLGTTYPHVTVKNAFGDAYVYSLCPMQNEVFNYALQLCVDLSTQHALHSLILETPGWLPYAHGYHHEFAQIHTSPDLEILLGLCFCDACKAAAKEKHIAIDALQQRVQTGIQSLLNQTDISPTQRTELFSDADLLAFISLRQDRVTALVRAIRQAIPARCALAVIPTVQRPTSACWIEGSHLHDLAQVADYLEIPFYEKSAQAAISDAAECLEQVAQPHKIRAILRPGIPDLNQGKELAAALQGLQQQGLRDFAFYNYGLLPQSQLTHLANTLEQEFPDAT